MVLPDYAGGSIVNLMRSLGDACGAPPSPYPRLRDFDLTMLTRSRAIVLLVLDGLGFRYLNTVGAGGNLHGHLWMRLTSVFPSTTASAVTALMTGVAAQQHGLTGWHMYLRELDRVAAILPLTPRTGEPFDDVEQLPGRLFCVGSLFDRMARRAYAISPASICDSPFNRYHCGQAARLAYKTTDEMFRAIEAVVRGDAESKFIYAYYPELDHTAHHYGIGSAEAAAVFHQLDDAFGAFLARLLGTGTSVLVTADHGFIDSPADRVIDAGDHPDFLATLARPLCGERRIAYCYVREDKRSEFEHYVRERFGACAELFFSRELLERGWFGSGAPAPRLAERIGDYTLVMRDDWTIKDWLPGEKRHVQVGVHGGVSEDEMYVPLLIART
ncbi:MAG: alkaline phosphatase family protein [Pseudomonadota bacterium]